GGGINVAEADLTVIQSTISNNESTAGGGGGINAASGDENANRNDVTIENSTISGNESATGGGGLNVFAGTSGTISSSTIADNDSGSANGGGLRYSEEFGSTFEVQNSIFNDNLANGITNTLSGPVESGGHNLFDDNAGSLIGPLPSDQFNTDAELLALADNGGPTFTHALGEDSDAIDMGFTDLGEDQRGFIRPAGSQPDIGAYEFGAVPEPSATPLLIGLAALLLVARRVRR
ncbi:MAG: choice-of-anchor Q domain-containing protein, partial [Verrucomicrobiota bacterium]